MLVEIWNGIPFLSPLWNPGPRVILLHHVHAEMWNMPSGPSWAPSGPCSKRRSPRRILVVDDSSPDGTADMARALGTELGRVDVLVRPEKGGLGVAYRAGFEQGFERGYDVLVQMDADLSHDPDALPALLSRIAGGADVAIGSRYVAGGSIPHWPMTRRALSRIGNMYASTVLGVKIRDCTAGYRAYRATVLRRVEADSTRATGYGFQVELAYRAHRQGATIVEVPITFKTAFGASRRCRGTSSARPCRW